MASSKGFCICPGPNMPRSPPFLALLQSLNSEARDSKVASLETILALQERLLDTADQLARPQSRWGNMEDF